MSWRTVVISSRAKLDYQAGFLVVRAEETKRVYLKDIQILVIESTAVSMTAYLLNELVKHKIRVVFCDEKRNPTSELQPLYGSHDSSLKIRNQIVWSKSTKELIWTEIVTEKIRKQAELLKRYHIEQADLLEMYISEILPGDSTNREGHAAKVYFNSLWGKAFSRSEECPINAALNYGYAILLSMFNREISCNGYITQLGLFHDNMFNQFNLSSDLMEPFRPIVDEMVLKLNPQKFEEEEKREMLHLLTKIVIIQERKEYLPNAIGYYVKSVFEALSESDVASIKFYKNEL